MLRRLGPPRPARIGLPLRHLREPGQRGRWLLAGVPRRRRADRHRVLSDQPADQGLQRPGLRLRHRAVRRPHRERARPPLHRERLLERADDAGVLPRAAIAQRARSTSSSPTWRRRPSARSREILHRTERPSRGRFHAGRGTNYGDDMVEMHISEIGLCSGHSGLGRLGQRAAARPPCPGSMPPGDMACVPHNYLLGAMTYGEICAENALAYVKTRRRSRS